MARSGTEPNSTRHPQQLARTQEVVRRPPANDRLSNTPRRQHPSSEETLEDEQPVSKRPRPTATTSDEQPEVDEPEGVDSVEIAQRYAYSHAYSQYAY